MDAKRSRSASFTQGEKDVLKEVVAKYASVIENRKTDANSSHDKKEAWMKVTSTYNSYVNVTQRNVDQLKKAWEKIKADRKKEASALKQHRMATGGGPSLPELPEDPLLDLATPYLLLEVDAEFDTDAIALRDSSKAELVARPASALASFAGLTGTPILNEDEDDSTDRNSPYLQSSLATVELSSSAAGERATCSTSRLEDAPTPSTARSRLGVLREEHATRMSEATIAASERRELHAWRMREVKALTAYAETIKQDAEEERAWNRKRRGQDSSGRERSPLP